MIWLLFSVHFWKWSIINANIVSQEEAKRIIHENLPAWCKEHGCDLKLYQDGETLYAGSNDGRRTCRMHAPVNSYIGFNIPGIHADGLDYDTMRDMLLSDPLQDKVRELQMASVLKLF